METKCLDIKNDCMWNGCELAADSYKMESLFNSKSSNEFGYDLFNLCSQYSSQDEFLDQLLGADLSSGDLLTSNNNNALTSNHNMNDIQTSQSANYYQCSASNYPANSVGHNGHPANDTTAMTNQLHQPAASPNKVTLSSSATVNNGNLAIVSYNAASNSSHHPLNNSLNSSLSAPLSKYDPQSSSALLGSSLNNEKNGVGYLTNDPLLTSNSANIILTQHNQTVDNSQLSVGQLNSNQISYSADNLSNLDISNRCTDLVSCSNELNADDCSSINCHSSVITGQPHHQLNTQNHSSDYHNNHGYQNVLGQNGHMMSGNYSFENSLMDSHTYCSGVNDSVCSSNNSDCSSSINPDDIEDDLDLLEDIIEEECDSGNLFSMHHNDQRFSRPIAQSLESSSDVEMMESPISDSLMNDHSYGASSIEKVTPLMTNSSLTNGRLVHHHSSMGGRRALANGHYGSPTKGSLIQLYDEHDSIQFTKSGKRRSLTSLQASANRRTIQKHHSGTSLLMKNKQAKLKKVMDIDRRKEHNESERQRRGVLKNAFSNLASRCPKLQNSNKKPSRIQTLNEATVYIRQLHDKDKNLKQQMELEEQRKAELERKLNSLLGQ